MGIPRLTQDLQPYLEDAIICTDDGQSSAVRVEKIVIDGPGMVYHIYNRLAAYMIEKSGRKDIYNPPSYRELSVAVEVFLTNLEDCGVEIIQIYFDGALPATKRAIRLNRLEKGLQQLEVFRLAYPRLGLSNIPEVEGRGYLSISSQTIWRTNISANANAGLPQSPFIVAAAREHLRTSRWSSRTSIVAGEADSYCAATARSLNTAVMTNDSDLVLYVDMQDNGVVILFNSLVKDTSEQNDHGCIHGSCWRPAAINRKLGLASLLFLGFERMKDSNCSFLSLKQRAQACCANTNTEEFTTFAKQFQSEDIYGGSGRAFEDTSSLRLDVLDTRLAELAFQFELSHNNQQEENLSFNIYFPVLHEDPTRDASWSYGRPLRQLGYSILYHYLTSSQSSPQHSHSANSNILVVEFLRKGQMISKENVRVLAYRELLAALRRYRDEVQESFSPHSNGIALAVAVSNYILDALGDVLLQRISNGKPKPSSRLIAQFLGLSPLPSAATHDSYSHSYPFRHQNQTSNGNDNGWDLLHLHASVHASLYSLRILKQCIDFVLLSSTANAPRSDTRTDTGINSQTPITNTRTNFTASNCTPSFHTNHLPHSPAEQQHLLTDLQTILAHLPSISALFLDPIDTSAHFAALPEPERCELIGAFCSRTGIDLSAFIRRPATSTAAEGGEMGSSGSHDNDEKLGFQEQRMGKRKGKRRKSGVGPDLAQKKTIGPEIRGSQNFFDVLRDRV